jgi:orotidine-5'-phosphate decarboxylase
VVVVTRHPSGPLSTVAPTVIVALDVPSLRDALSIVARLGDACRFYKVGSELFAREGPAAVTALRERGRDVFLDLKFHDIPNTVRKACESACAIGATLVTVHASGGPAMLHAAVEGAGTACGVLAVTVLTSLDAEALGDAWGREQLSVEQEVLRLAALAQQSGVHGVVCSGREVAAITSRFGSALAPLVPGLRLPGGAAHDQARAATPGEAAKAGARYLVMGRAVTGATDPAAALAAVDDDIKSSLAER